ncbi:uncharacterized protein LOC108679044 isoform X2 [Hyalella azteca]|uniref:Uncharacterized protein LOC108679044 isoform X2 n=1 Tax=Hyalella azteca TaxID=294128 RepID=A0A8B7PAE0_HYAAZ|nr:uncharacterized protein LOC108679044 isoform X2 [Hyalella azteca]
MNRRAVRQRTECSAFCSQGLLRNAYTNMTRRTRACSAFLWRRCCWPSTTPTYLVKIRRSTDEDVEDAILDNFPFDRITVDLWYIEHRYPNTSINEMGPGVDPVFVSKFEKRGYTFVPTAADYVFIHNDSEYMTMAVYPKTVVTRVVTVIKEVFTEVPII